jgi:hypothetical protein
MPLARRRRHDIADAFASFQPFSRDSQSRFFFIFIGQPPPADYLQPPPAADYADAADAAIIYADAHYLCAASLMLSPLLSHIAFPLRLLIYFAAGCLFSTLMLRRFSSADGCQISRHAAAVSSLRFSFASAAFLRHAAITLLSILLAAISCRHYADS